MQALKLLPLPPALRAGWSQWQAGRCSEAALFLAVYACVSYYFCGKVR
jgi:hypothetical protein